MDTKLWNHLLSVARDETEMILEGLPDGLREAVRTQLLINAAAKQGIQSGTAEYDDFIANGQGAVISALVVAKSILLANATPMLHWFNQYRLLYNVLWRILLYLLIIQIFQT